MARRARCRRPARRRRPRHAPADARRRTRPARRQRPDRVAEHALRQHDPGLAGRADPRRSADRAPAAVDHPLERDGDGRSRQQAVLRARRSHRLLPVAGDAVRGRLQPLLARAVGRARRRPRLLPGPLLPRQLRPRLPRGPPDRGAARQLPPGGRRQRPLLLPAPVADAGLLAVPDGVARHRRDHLDLPGAVHAVPGRTLDQRDRRPQGLGVPRRR